MSKTIRIRKGINIKLKGAAEKVLTTPDPSRVIAVKPADFHGITPKLAVKQGDEVLAGTPLFYDKYNDKVKFTSPVSGEVAEIVRGEKRRILEVRIIADKDTKYLDLGAGDPSSQDRDAIIEKLLASGCWSLIKQRPFDIIASPDQTPLGIFVSCFNSAPLAADLDFVVNGQGDDFQAGLNALAKLTTGKVHLGISPNSNAKEFKTAKGVEITTYKGPHPAGNVGVQIHHISPINKGETRWTVGVQGVIQIGKLFRSGKFDATRVVAIGGGGADKAGYVRTIVGAPLADLVNKKEGYRYISGNVLTGDNVGPDGALGMYHDEVTVLEEGNEPKFFITDGWAGPGLNKFSMSRSYPSWLMPGKKYELDTNQNGEERAFVMTGQYEKVFPFDIYPVPLLKSILYNDIEEMEKLGLYEVAPEDFALCEFVCTSKINSQAIIREGLDVLKKETT